MSKIDHHNLLKFLSKPRFAHEVAKHYGISKKLANFQLRKAVKSGQVLISERPVFQTLRNPEGRLKRFGGFVYVFRNSPMLAVSWQKLERKDVNDLSSKSKGSAFSIGFLSKTHGLIGKGVFNQRFSGFSFDKTAGSHEGASHFKAGGFPMSEFNVSSAKVKLAKARTVDQLLRHRVQSTQEEVKSLSYAERIRLLRALSKEPLPFLDLHGRFGVSKQTIRGLVKNGLLMEVWGPKAIGVVFKLTDKGKIHLKELETAAKFEPKIRETALIRLKQRVAV